MDHCWSDQYCLGNCSLGHQWLSRSDQVITGRVSAGEVIADQVQISQVNAGQVKSSQVVTNKVIIWSCISKLDQTQRVYK